MQSRIGGALLALALTGAAPDQPPPERKSESVAQAMCRLIDGAARSHQLPPAFLTRLIWRDVGGLDDVDATLAGSTRLAETCLRAALAAVEAEFALK